MASQRLQHLRRGWPPSPEKIVTQLILTHCDGAQLGHQAAQCTNGTINWRQIYGDEEFRLKPPVYHSEVVEWLRKKKVDILDLEKRAKEFAEVLPSLTFAIDALCRNPSQGMCSKSAVWVTEDWQFENLHLKYL